MNNLSKENVLDQIFNDEKKLDKEFLEWYEENNDDELESKKPNIMWVINKDTLDEIITGVENNIFTQASVRITNAMYLAKLGKTKQLYDLMKKNPNVINEKTCNGRTPLMFAAQFGNINCLKLLIVGGAHLNEQDEHGATALMLASFFGQNEAVKILLENGANKMIKDCNNVNAKMLAKKNKDTLIYKMIDEFNYDQTNDFLLNDNKSNHNKNSEDVFFI